MTATPPPAAPQPGYASPVPASEKWNVLAIVSFVGSLIGFSLIASILGFVALSQIKKTGERGRGLALAAVIIGIATLVLYIILIIVSVIAAAALSNAGYTTY